MSGRVALAASLVASPLAHGAEPEQGSTDTKPFLGSLFEGVRVTGLAQVDYLHRQISLDEVSDGTGEPLNEDRFLVRRARFGARRDWRYVGVLTTLELFSGGTTVRPVEFDVHGQIPAKEVGAPPPLRLSAGLIPVPFGFESYEETDDERFFGERTLFTYGLVPGRYDLGVALSGNLWAVVDWIVALQNGEPIEGPYDYDDPNAAKDVTGRLRVSSDRERPVRVAAGTSLLVGKGFSAGTPPTKDSFEWRDLDEDGRVLEAELAPIPGSAGRPSENFDGWGVSGDVQLWADLPHLGVLFVYGEVVVALNLNRGVAPADPVLLGRDQQSIGFMGALVQQLTRHFSVGGRYEQYEPSVEAVTMFEGVTVVTRQRFQTLTVGVSAHHAMSERARARLHVEYEAQANTLGLDNQGLPAQLDNDTFRVRAEVKF